ncbi:hypothetical protein PAXRUDRAFT_28988, partial [Paxillus rubicundulus Ve08.2h10]
MPQTKAEETIPEAVEALGDGQAKGAHVAGPVEDSVATDSEAEEFDEDASEDGEANDGMQRRLSRQPVKLSFRERVKEAHRMLDQPPKNVHEEIHTACSQTASKGNLLSKGTPSCALTGSNISIQSKSWSTTTHTSGALIPLMPVNTVVDTSSVCIAGLGEGEDDIYEHPVGIKGNVNLKGKDARKSLVSIAGDEDDNIMLPLSLSIKQSQRSTSMTSKLKRKALDTISLSSGEEFELDDTGIDGPTTGIDSDIEIVDANSRVDHDEASTYNAPPKFKKSVKHSIHTTHSKVSDTASQTMVKLSESKLHWSRKRKWTSNTVPLGSGCLLKAEGVIKPCSAYHKEDLPGFVLSDPQGRWHKKFLPTLILLLSTIRNLFDLPESSLAQFAQSTFHIIYPEVHNFIITSTGPIIAK